MSVYYNATRGPKIGSNNANWPDSTSGDYYVDYIDHLRSGGMTDEQIATALLDHDDSAFGTQTEKRAAAMLHGTVYMAEEWRKQGAAKIFRAILRNVQSGKTKFQDFLIDFKFIQSAQDGRKMVGRFYDVYNEDASLADLPKQEQVIHGALSPEHTEDWSSDDELRTPDKKNLQGKRLFAQKHGKKHDKK